MAMSCTQHTIMTLWGGTHVTDSLSSRRLITPSGAVVRQVSGMRLYFEQRFAAVDVNGTERTTFEIIRQWARLAARALWGDCI